MVRGAQAPPMLRGVEYAVTLRRTLPPYPSAGAETTAERYAALSLTGRSWGGAVAPTKQAGVPAAAAAATELARQVEQLLGCCQEREGSWGGAGLGEGVRGGCAHFYI